MKERNLTFMEDGSPIREGDYVVFMYRDSDPRNDDHTHLGKVRSEDGALYADSLHCDLFGPEWSARLGVETFYHLRPAPEYIDMEMNNALRVSR